MSKVETHGTQSQGTTVQVSIFKIYRENNITMTALWCVIMAEFIMPETQQPIIVIIYFPYMYLLKDLVEL